MSDWTVQSRRISRRNLIRTGAAASVFAATGFASVASPRPGGTLRIAVPGPGDAGPWAVADLFGRLIAPGSVFDCLTEIGPDGQLRGELAERWSADASAVVWEVFLRSGVRFHDGRDLDAMDVVHSLRRHLGPEGVLANVSRVRAMGGGSIQIRLRSADPQLPLLLADPSLVIRPSGAGPGDLVGTGLYRVSAFAPGELARLERVTAHYRDGQGGWFNAIELLRIRQPVARADALATGRVDVAADIDPGFQSRLASRTRQGVLRVGGRRNAVVSAFGVKSSALREALEAGLDPRGLSAYLSGDGKVENVISDYRAARDVLRGAKVREVTVSVAEATEEWPGAGRMLQAMWAFAGATDLSVKPLRSGADLQVSTTWGQAGGAGPEPALSVEVPSYWGFSTRLSQVANSASEESIDASRIAERWFFA